MSFLSPVFNDEDAPTLKNFIRDSLEKHLGDNYSVKKSTSVITVCLVDDEGKQAIKSFDIALLKKNQNTTVLLF